MVNIYSASYPGNKRVRKPQLRYYGVFRGQKGYSISKGKSLKKQIALFKTPEARKLARQSRRTPKIAYKGKLYSPSTFAKKFPKYRPSKRTVKMIRNKLRAKLRR